MNVILPMEGATRNVTTQSGLTTVPATSDSYWMKTTMDVLVTQCTAVKILMHSHVDINECAVGNGGCDQHCQNTNGSYHCTCDGGWRLDPDSHTCNGDYIIVQLDRQTHIFSFVRYR